MSTTTKEITEGKKYINLILAVGAMLLGYVVYSLVHQLGIWFELEAKMSQFQWLPHTLSVVSGIAFFVLMLRQEKVVQYLQEVYIELTKVVWSDRDSTIKLTIGILIGLIITGIVLSLVDLGINKILSLLYSAFGL
jgi:preprotein translocase subunit SecE